MGTKSCVVIIAGGSAAGKTTLTRALKHCLEATASRIETLCADAFFRADRTQGPNFFSPSLGEELFNCNHPDAIEWDRLLASIIARSTAVDAPHFLLVEGLMVLHRPEIRQQGNVRIFVELEADVRALRRLLRDMKGERGNTDPQWIANYYLECARIGHSLFVEPSRIHADFIVRGDADFSRLLPLLSAAITSML